MNKETGGPAFPNKQEYSEHGNSWFQYETGMTLRDYFAAKAMQGVVPGKMWKDWEEIVRAAYGIADAMIAERAKEK